MLNQDVVLSVRDISKRYYTHKGSIFNRKRKEDEFWALKGVSFELRKGEILGIIGLNGAGKSTILKILSEVIPPTSGEVEYQGSILSILDIGTGFHPDLSGYENIFLNASLLGLKKEQIQLKIDEIIEFSGIEKYIHEPVKNYSSGMYLRLALSIALFTDNEIILLDEVISVGDAEFRYKAIQKIRDQANKGRACIMISHDLNSILDLSDNCLLLEKGAVVYSGKSREVVEDYFNTVYGTMHDKQTPVLEHECCKLISIEKSKEEYLMDEPIRIKVRYEVKKEADVRVVIKVRNYTTPILSDCDAYRQDYVEKKLLPGIYETDCVIPLSLFNNGTYFIDAILCNNEQMFVEYQFADKFAVLLKEWERDKVWNQTSEIIPFRPICHWSINKMS